MYKIVFIDDEFLILEGLKKILDWESLHIEIVGTAQNAIDGLALIREKNPDIVITDIRMRGMDGLELIHAAIQSGYDGYTLILSGYKEFEYARKAIDNKVFRYLLKPIDLEELKSTIEEIIALIQTTDTKRKENRNIFHDILRYIGNHFTEDIQLGKIAEMYHFEATYFSKKFKEKIGVNYSEYVTTLRIDAAKRYLLETDLTVEEISDCVGYKDVRYFREIFKRTTGFSPREFKKEQQKKDDEIYDNNDNNNSEEYTDGD